VNLERWRADGQPARWVERHQGHWGHGEWLELLSALEASDYWPLEPDAVGRALEEHKRVYWNLRRWEESGEAYRWVEAHRGEWTHTDWLRLVASLERSAFWPVDPQVVGAVLEQAKLRYHNLKRWQQSGAARLWVAIRQGEWDQGNYLDLLAHIEQAAPGQVEPTALGELLEEMRREYRSLRRWLEARQPAYDDEPVVAAMQMVEGLSARLAA
jgi:hypothetical protein